MYSNREQSSITDHSYCPVSLILTELIVVLVMCQTRPGLVNNENAGSLPSSGAEEVQKQF